MHASSPSTLPSVTVCIPSHRPHLLKEAMASVFHQTAADVQCLVSAASAYWPDKINSAVRAAAGEYIVILPDDDVLLPTFVERTVAKAREGYEVVYTDYGRWDGTTAYHWPARAWAFESFCDPMCNPLCGMTWLVRREAFLARGGFDPALTFADWGIAYALFASRARAYHLAEPLVLYRVHEDQSHFGATEGVAQLRAKYPELAVPCARLPFTSHRLVA